MILYCWFTMITDIQLAMFSNFMGILLFLLVVLFHFISANAPRQLH